MGSLLLSSTVHVVPQAGDLAASPDGFSFAIGMFDGVHLGHQAVVASAVEHSKAQGLTPTAITFEPHPLSIIRPDRAPLRLQTPAHRIHTLAELGIRSALVHPFTREFSQETGEAYIRRLLSEVPGPIRFFSVGEGFHFGHNRSGDTHLLEVMGRQLGFEVQVVPPVLFNGDSVSSSRIRRLVREGNFPAASALLGRPYTVESTVQTGDRLGRTLGFPTANLNEEGLELPPHGVYAVWTRWRDQKVPAVLNLGVRPTLSQPLPRRRLEVHLLDFSADLYGETLSVEWGIKLRNEQRFPDISTLRLQIQRDVEAARQLLRPSGSTGA